MGEIVISDLLARHYYDDFAVDRLESILLRKSAAGRILSADKVADRKDRISEFAYSICLYIRAASEIWLLPDRLITCCVIDTEVSSSFAAKLGADRYVLVFSTRMMREMEQFSRALICTHNIALLLGIAIRDTSIVRGRISPEGQPELVVPVGPGYETEIAIIYRAMTSILVFHELGHILNGHLDLRNDACLSAVSPLFTEEEYPLTMRCLEFDADCFAGSAWGRLIGTRCPLPVEFGAVSSSVEQLFPWIIVSSAGLLMYENIGFDPYINNRRVLKDYLPARTRFENISLTLAQILSDRFSLDIAYAVGVIRPAFDKVLEGVRDWLPQMKHLLSGRFDPSAPLTDIQLNLVARRYARLRPFLDERKQIRRGQLAAAQVEPI